MQRQLILFVIVLVVTGVGVSACFAQDAAANERQLLDAAKNGNASAVEALLKGGISVGIKDAAGRTPLHLAAGSGHQMTAQTLLDHGADINAKDGDGHTPLDAAVANGHAGTAKFLQSKGGVKSVPDGSNASSGNPPSKEDDPRTFSPNARHTTAEAFSEAIGEPAVMLDSPNVRMLVPKRREEAARIVFPYLVRAYDELYKLVGVHTRFKMLIYAYPKGHDKVFGGTGTDSTQIYYDDQNLDLEKQEEWTRYHVPHVRGYIEEMAHNFVAASKARFTSEMVGWSISVGVSKTVASNPIHDQSVAQTRKNQEETYRRYLALGQTIPADLPWNQADRVYAWLLYKCEQQYGPAFWRDFFKEVRKERQAFLDAETQGTDNGRDARYKLTLQCFDRLPGIHFTQLLEQNGISTTVDLTSLNHKDPRWNRKLH